LTSVKLLQLQDLEQQLSCGVQSNRDTKADLLQRDIAKLTFEEGSVVLFESAKAKIGAAKVQHICEAMVQFLFFKNSGAHARLSVDNNLAIVQFVPDHDDHRSHYSVLQVPNIDRRDLRIILTAYMSLFVWEMSLRGFRLSASLLSQPSIWLWLIEHL